MPSLLYSLLSFILLMNILILEQTIRIYYGTGVKLGFGKEWWLAGHAALGLGFVYRYVDIASYANDDFRENEKIKNGSYSYYGIFLSLGYDP